MTEISPELAMLLSEITQQEDLLKELEDTAYQTIHEMRAARKALAEKVDQLTTYLYDHPPVEPDYS